MKGGEWLGFVAVGLFYGIISVLGIWLSRRKMGGGGRRGEVSTEDLILAGRDLGLVVGIFTLVATEVGGAFVNGTAEEVYSKGFLWSTAPIAYSLSMSINGLFFLPALRKRELVTLIDALQASYGRILGFCVYIPSFVGDICWTAAVLSALGKTLSIVLGIQESFTICASAAIAVSYTLIGGMFSVAYTDVIQLIFTAFGLWISLPFMLTSTDVGLANLTLTDWTGSFSSSNFVSYADTFLMLICGGIPWQGYYQRALAVRTTSQAQTLSYVSTIICILCMIPPALIGAIAKSSGKVTNLVGKDSSKVLPITVATLTPQVVTYMALGAVSAASMSSVDSAVLSGSSYFTHNIYKRVIRPEAGRLETLLVLRGFMVILGIFSTVLALSASSIYGLWVLAGDLGYVVVFPQFLCAVKCPNRVNGFGSIIAVAIAGTLRILIGEPAIGLPASLNSWNFAGTSDSVLPIKTLIMVCSLISLLGSSALYDYYTKRRRIL